MPYVEIRFQTTSEEAMNDRFRPPSRDSGGNVTYSSDAWRQLNLGLKLSARQLEVVRALFHGESHKEIAKRLRLKVNTVNTHLKRIYEKLGVSDQMQMTLKLTEILRGLSPKGDRKR